MNGYAVLEQYLNNIKIILSLALFVICCVLLYLFVRDVSILKKLGEKTEGKSCNNLKKRKTQATALFHLLSLLSFIALEVFFIVSNAYIYVKLMAFSVLIIIICFVQFLGEYIFNIFWKRREIKEL